MDRLSSKTNPNIQRTLKCVKHSPYGLIVKGKNYIDLSSNDYLGLASNLEFQNEFLRSLPDDQFLLGSLSSRLLTGNDEIKEDLENDLKLLYQKEACLLYNSGYHLNTGILPALAEKDDLILADKLVHASILDGLRLVQCRWQRFRHNDLNDLEQKLKGSIGKYKTVFVVTEGIFSMDGDSPDLVALIELKERYPFLLYIDEAHSFGIRGTLGKGVSEEQNILDHVDILAATFGKALAGEGAFVACSQSVRQHLINHSRSLIFSTATAPIMTLWAQFAVKKMITMKNERIYLENISHELRNYLSHHYETGGQSHIIPLIFQNDQLCQEKSLLLQQKGIWVLPIRYPTVPVNQPRIRLSLSSALTPHHLETIREALLA